MNSLRTFSNALLISTLLLLSACGGGSETPVRTVEYQQSTLIVHGTRYERQAEPPGPYVAKDLIVSIKPGRLAEGQKLMKELSLPVESTLQAVEVLLIKVPAGFEKQWANALMSFDVVFNATRNITFTIPDTRPVVDVSIAAQYEGTTLIVRGTRYERLPPTSGGYTYAPKDVIVGFEAGRMAEGLQLMKDLDLPVRSTMNALEVVVITVPEGFEAQWVLALLSIDVVRSASRNALMSLPATTPVSAAPAGS